MMGVKTTAKVNLLDEWHVACFLLDPFGHLLPHLPNYTDLERVQVMENIIKVLIPGDGDEAKEQRSECFDTFTQFWLQTGDFGTCFETSRREALEPEAAKEDAKKLTLTMVNDWINATGGHNSRLRWWKIRYGIKLFYKKIVKPLLSVRTTGSITVERVAKTIKNNVCISIRNRLRSNKASLMMRVGWNLRLLKSAGIDTKKIGKI